MKQILFTKTNLNREKICETLNAYSVDFQDFIKICFKSFQLSDVGFQPEILLFTSENGVKGFLRSGLQFPENQKVCTVGEKTAGLARQNSAKVIFSAQNAEYLLEYFLENRPQSVLHFTGNLSLDVFEDKLSSAKIIYKKIEVYETVPVFLKLDKNYDAAVFFSPSGVSGFAKNHSFERLKIFSIGETTSQEIRKHTENEVFTSKKNTTEDLLQMILSSGI